MNIISLDLSSKEQNSSKLEVTSVNFLHTSFRVIEEKLVFRDVL